MFTLRRGKDRGITNFGWLDSRHSFSFGDYFDSKNHEFHALRVINDDRVAPGGAQSVELREFRSPGGAVRTRQLRDDHAGARSPRGAARGEVLVLTARRPKSLASYRRDTRIDSAIIVPSRYASYTIPGRRRRVLSVGGRRSGADVRADDGQASAATEPLSREHDDPHV